MGYYLKTGLKESPTGIGWLQRFQLKLKIGLTGGYHWGKICSDQSSSGKHGSLLDDFGIDSKVCFIKD